MPTGFSLLLRDFSLLLSKIVPRLLWPSWLPLTSDHGVIVSERQLRRVLKEYVELYFNRARPHQGLWQGIPVAGSRSVPKVGGKVVSIPILGGLHHDYQQAA